MRVIYHNWSATKQRHKVYYNMHKFRNDSLKLGVCIAHVKSASQPSFLQVTNATGVRLQSQPSACLLPSLGNQGSHSNDIIKNSGLFFLRFINLFFHGGTRYWSNSAVLHDFFQHHCPISGLFRS